MKIRPVGAELFHSDRHTNRLTKLTEASCNFENVPHNRLHLPLFMLFSRKLTFVSKFKAYYRQYQSSQLDMVLR
jgi:hypothetical protein